MDGHFLARYETIRASWFHYGLMTQSTTYRVRMPHDGDTVIGNRCLGYAKKGTVVNFGDGLRRRRRCSPWHVLLKRTPFRHFHSTLFCTLHKLMSFIDTNSTLSLFYPFKKKRHVVYVNKLIHKIILRLLKTIVIKVHKN